MSLQNKNIHNDLQSTIQLVYNPCGFDYTEPKAEAESAEYGAAEFTVNGKFVKHRAAKITPTKTGLFVTIWKRNRAGETAPFDHTDDIDLLVISARKNERFGQFIFPKSVLTEQGIITGTKAGKRGMRVYPPWDETTNKQAQKTQQWQLAFFLEIDHQSTDLNRAKVLYK